MAKVRAPNFNLGLWGDVQRGVLPGLGPCWSQCSVDWKWGQDQRKQTFFSNSGEGHGALSNGGVGEKTAVLLAWRVGCGREVSAVSLFQDRLTWLTM